MLGPLRSPLCIKMKTPLNFITSTPSIFIGLPPQSAHHFRVVSTSRTMVCHAPSDTPASFGGNSWARNGAAGDNNIVIGVNSRTNFFIDNSSSFVSITYADKPGGQPTPHQ